jgi:FkbM family methyltransferase
VRVDLQTAGGDQFACDLPDLIQTYLYLFETWEPDLAAHIRACLREGDVFVDVGANIGFDSLLAARRVGPGGRVVAIEASPVIFDRLLETLRANGSPANVRPIQKALAETVGVLDLFAGPTHNIGLTTTVQRRGMRQLATVESAPLADLLDADEIGRARFIKIDVEGGEIGALAGVIPCLDRLPYDVQIAVELSPRWWPRSLDRDRSVADAVKPFVERGFHVFTVPNDYWPWRYLWPRDVRKPRRVDELASFGAVRRLDLILARKPVEEP